MGRRSSRGPRGRNPPRPSRARTPSATQGPPPGQDHGSDRLADGSNREAATRDSSIRGGAGALTLGRFGAGTDEEDGDGDGRFPEAAAAELRRVSTMACAGGEGFLSARLRFRFFSTPRARGILSAFEGFFFPPLKMVLLSFFGVNERRGKEGPPYKIFQISLFLLMVYDCAVFY